MNIHARSVIPTLSELPLPSRMAVAPWSTVKSVPASAMGGVMSFTVTVMTSVPWLPSASEALRVTS